MRSLLPLLVLTAACQEYDLKQQVDPEDAPAPDIVVNPPSIDFGTLEAGGSAVESFEIENVGDAVLSVSGVEVTVGDDVFRLLSDTTYELQPSDSVSLDVEFVPYADEHFGLVTIDSNDPDEPEATVDLLGLQTIETTTPYTPPDDTPYLTITPMNHDFGELFVPCSDDVRLEMKNEGSATLEITDVSFASGGLMAFDNLGVGLPLTLEPDESVDVEVTFDALAEGADQGVLEVTSNDPRGVITATQDGESLYAAYTTEEFLEPGRAPVDIVMLIDQSGSMSSNQGTIEDGIPDFLAELANVADWQLIQVTDSDGCGNQGIIDQNTANAENILINNAFSIAGGLGLHTEALLKHGDTALAKDAPGKCNEGFLRSGALLHLIMISDEEDQSPNTWQHWVSQYEGYVIDPALVKVSAVVDVNGTSCGNYQPGYSVGPGGYLDAALATGGEVLDICDPNWGQNLDDIAAAAVAGIRSYNLAKVTDEATITVTVNGVPTTDFDYEAAGSTVTINSPPVGEYDVVEITYAEPATCN